MENPQRREEELFALSLAKPDTERAAFLDGACHDDPALRARLEALLASHDQSQGLNPSSPDRDGPTVEVTDNELHDETIGSTIGHYKVLQNIGEGGCGAVYMAEQFEPVRRRVALKVIKLGMDTKAVIARFEAERQALALMDHPNIAKVLDAGSTDSGRPYFVMELVRGIKITDYCDQNKLDTQQRLELFIQVCQAIQHAHQKGIIHRDIKPSNILVTLHDGIPVPKVIDFGIAKATTDQRLTDKTLFTAYEQFIGTPAYMSPEQAEMSGLDIDTRSDIYSLGVLLYELLTGRTPFDGRELMSLGIDAMRKTIREKEPVRPSTKLHTLQGEDLTTTARQHGVEVSRLAHLLRGDLDWIVMKCLEKDRVRRYDTANGLAMDIQRHLSHEPVTARPPSKLYEFQKTVRRHKVGFTAAAAVVAALATGIIAASWQAVSATQAKREAQAAQQEALLARASESAQRQKAEDNAKAAVTAQRQAEQAEARARRRAYASEMNAAKQALDRNNLGSALQLLDRQRPQAGDTDLRGWEWRYLWNQTRSGAEFKVCDRDNEVSTLAASADGRFLAAAHLYGGRLSVWELQTRQEIVVGTNLTWVHAAFAPTGSLLAFTDVVQPAPGEDHYTLRLWNLSTRKLELERELEDECVGLAFSQDGKTLVTSTLKSNILWSVTDGQILAGYPCDQMPLVAATPFAATPELDLVAHAWGREWIGVRDLQTGDERWRARASDEYITALAFSTDGRVLASAAGFNERTIRLWDVATGTEISPPLEGHASFVSSIVFFPDGRRMASGSGDQTIRIWDITTGECLDILRGHTLEVYRLALLPNSNLLASGSKDGVVCLWDTSKSHLPHRRDSFNDKVAVFCFTTDGQSIRTVDLQGNVIERTGEGFEQETQLLKRPPLIDEYAACFSTDGRLVALATELDFVEVWDLQRRTPPCQLTNARACRPLEFLEDGSQLLTWSDQSHTLDTWDLATKQRLQSWTQPIAHEWDHETIITPDGQHFIAFGSEGHTIRGGLEDGNRETLALKTPEVSNAVFSPDGRYLALGSTLGFAQVVDTQTWQEHRKLTGYLVAVKGVCFSPDGKRLVTGSDNLEALRLWDTESWHDVLTLEGDEDSFLRIFYSQDGRRIAAVGQNGALNIWSAPSWDEIDEMETRQRQLNATP